MSELNSGKIKITNDGNIIMQFSNYHHVIDSDTELYYKHQADKVIAELKAQKAQAEDDCAYWKTMAQKNAADNAVMAKQRAEALKRERHHKYKRCLDNAWWCRNSSNAYAWSASNLRGWKIAVYYDKKAELYRKWHKRWLELSEKFKT